MVKALGGQRESDGVVVPLIGVEHNAPGGKGPDFDHAGDAGMHQGNPAAPEFGRYGTVNVRYGKAKRGQPPRRRNVASVMGWAVEAAADYVENVRPKFGCAEHPALWVTERGGRIKPSEINARFVAYRDALGLPRNLVPHSIWHSYVSNLTEDGVDRRFIQCQVGHEVDSSTAVYTHVSTDFMNTALRKALSPALGSESTRREGR